MARFIFTATREIEADTEEEAMEIFADESWDFAAEAEIDKVED